MIREQSKARRRKAARLPELPAHVEQTIAAAVRDRVEAGLPSTLFGRRRWTFTTPYPPSDNNLYMTIGKRRVLTGEGRAFKKTVAALALAAGVRETSGDFVIFLDVYRPTRAGDAQNRGKALIDALKGVAFADDVQMLKTVISRHTDPDRPRAEVELWAIDGGELQ